MRKIIMAAILATGAAFGQTFVQHLKCDLETANGASLPPRTISQGTTPLWSVDLCRNGQPVAAVTDGTTRAVVVLAQSATGTLFAAVTNTATSTNGYTIQWPVVGTNSGGALSAPWWYMVLIQTTGGKTYWTGSGRLTIEPSSWSGQDGLGWGAGTANNYAVLIAAEAAIRSNADVAINTRIDNLIVGAGLTTNDCQTIVSGILPTATVAYAVSAGTATTALAVAWSNVTERPSTWPGTATDSVARIVASAANDAAIAASVTGATHTAQLTALEGRTNQWNAALTNAAAFEAAGAIAIHNTNQLAHLTLASIVYVTNQLAGYVPRTETNGQVTTSHTYLESGLSALTTSVSAANSTGAIHTAQIATQESFRAASTVNYATNAGNAATVNGLTSTQIMAQATNSFAQRSWVAGFSNAPASWDAADATIEVSMPDGTTGQMFEELWMPIKNTAGVPLTNGVCVRVEDASGALSGVRLVACTDTWDQVLGTIGLSTMTTATTPNGDGKITTFGNVNDLDTTMFVEGSNLWLSSTPGQLTMEKPTAAGCKQILIGKCLRSHANQGRISVGVRIIPRPDDIGAVATNDARYLATLTNGGPVAMAAITATNAFAITEDPSGFAGETDSARTYSFNPTTRVLTVSGASTVYRDGQVLSNFTTCAWPAIGTNAGIWYLSWKHGTSLATATQTVSQTEWALDDIQCATVYWSGGTATVSTIPTFIIGEETHGFMPWTVHRRFHLTDGSKWASGLSFSGSAKVFTNSSGIWLDEDIAHQVAQSSSSRVMWRSAGLSTPVFGTPGTQYVITNGLGGADLMYDSSGTLTTVPANNYVNYWIYVVPGSVSDYLVVVGRTVSTTLATVTAETPYDLTGLQPFAESVLLYRVTLRNANPPVVTQTTDYRKSGTTGVSYSPTAHATLTGRDAVDSHPLAAITGWENLLTNGGPVAVAATNAQTQVTNHIAQTGNSAHAGMMLTNGNAVALTNFPALVVQTNFSSLGDWHFVNNRGAAPGAYAILSPVAEKTNFSIGTFVDGTFKASFTITESLGVRHINGTNGFPVAYFSDAFRVGPNGDDLPVYITLTNTAQQVTNLTTLTTTHTAQIATNTANITSNASPYQPWTQVMGTPTNLGTTVMSFTNGSMPFLSCTGAQTVAWIDGNANGWGTAGVNRQRLALWKGSWSVTIQSNASVVHASTITLSSTKTNHIVANITVGSGYTNVVLYPLTAQ